MSLSTPPSPATNPVAEAKSAIENKIGQLWKQHQEKLPPDMRLDLSEEISHLLMRLRQSKGGNLVEVAKANAGMVASQLFALGAAGISLKQSSINEHAYVLGGTANQPIRLAPSAKGLIFIAHKFYGAKLTVRVVRKSEVDKVYVEEGKAPTLPPLKFEYAEDDEVGGIVAYARMPDGSNPFVFINGKALVDITKAIAQLHGRRGDANYKTQFRQNFESLWLEKTALRRLITQKIINHYNPLVSGSDENIEKVIDLHDSNTDGWQKDPVLLSNEELKQLVSQSHQSAPQLDSQNLAQLVLAEIKRGNKEITKRQSQSVLALAQKEVDNG